MAIKSQLTDSGAVIGYRPELKYEKTNTKIDGTNAIYHSQDNDNYTNTLQSYLNNQPNFVISGLNDEIETINEQIERLAEKFKEKEYDNHSDIDGFINSIESGNIEYVNAFLQYHKTDISKSQIPEIIWMLETEKERLTIFNDALKTLYYGTSNITDEECKQKDSEIASVLSKKDKQGKGVNYVTLSCDSVLNKSLDTYISKVDGSCILLEEVAYTEDDSNMNNPILLPMIENLFQDIDKEIDARMNLYNEQQSIDSTTKALYNYYVKRKELNQFYDIVSETSSDGSFLLSKISSFENKLDSAIENINRTTLGNVYYLQSISDLMTEKQQLRSLYVTINYT